MVLPNIYAGYWKIQHSKKENLQQPASYDSTTAKEI
jgi:hypothetical protein